MNILLGILLCTQTITAQKEDHIWYTGRVRDASYLDKIELLNDTIHGHTTLDFNHDPVKIYIDNNRKLPVRTDFTLLCDEEGSIYAYSNGMCICDSSHQLMAGGEKVGYSDHWVFIDMLGLEYPGGYNLCQLSILLPWPGKPDSILFIGIGSGNEIIGQRIYTDKTVYAIISKSGNGGLGEVLVKDIEIPLPYMKYGRISAVRHGNGRDWWVNMISEDGGDYYLFILDPEGIRLHSVQSVGLKRNGVSLGQAVFSHKGDRFALNDSYYNTNYTSNTFVSVFNFNRCTGQFSQRRFDVLNSDYLPAAAGIAFSPDDRYLYANNSFELVQYDMNISSMQSSKKLINKAIPMVDEWGGHAGFDVYFGHMKTGPDGIIYDFGGASIYRNIHTIDMPDDAGTGASSVKNKYRVRFQGRTCVNAPNYRLGPLDGSSCDTLGIDNHPEAKFRYVADSLDHLQIRFIDLSYFRPTKWVWTFGDGQSSTQRLPTHVYGSTGTYEVCLTVSNENSSNTTCRTLVLGTTSTSDPTDIPRADISIFPNPVQDDLLLMLGEYIPEHGGVYIYDISGRQMLYQRVYYGWNSIDMSRLATGSYIYRVMDGGKEIGKGKVVKM